MMKLSRRSALASCAAYLAHHSSASAGRDRVATEGEAHADAVKAYATPDLLPQLPFGTHSHWLQPWRHSVRTVPNSVFKSGLGINLRPTPGALRPGAVEMLARCGIRTMRIEINWGEVDYATETRLQHERRLRALLLACRRCGVRPLILLNAHHGHPAPFQVFKGRTLAPASKGDRSIQVFATEEIRPRLTGISDLTGYFMAEALVTRVEGSRLHLAKPLPVALEAGARLKLATLRYEPFSIPGSSQNDETMRGWLRYVDLVAGFVTQVLDTRAGADRGFDIEIWNELTFGSKFLSLNNYYDPKPLAYQSSSIWTDLVERTAAHVAAHALRFSGVAMTNGFGATVPWVASSLQPARVSAISKHPYPPIKSFPRDEQRDNAALGANGKPTNFVPRYTCFFPEYFATAIQTETLMRDVASSANAIYGTQHGRMARTLGEKPAPVGVWLTEIGLDLREHGMTDGEAGARLKTKFSLRSVLFHLGIGVDRVYLFEALGNTNRYALVPDAASTLPTPPLQALERAISVIGGLQGNLFEGPVRPLSFGIVSNPSAGMVVEGNGDPGTPSLRSTDCLVLLPFQSAPGRLVIAYYVMTRDVRTDMPPEVIQLQVAGLPGTSAKAEGYDPLTDLPVPCRIVKRHAEQLALEVTVTDAPRFIVLSL